MEYQKIINLLDNTPNQVYVITAMHIYLLKEM